LQERRIDDDYWEPVIHVGCFPPRQSIPEASSCVVNTWEHLSGEFGKVASVDSSVEAAESHPRYQPKEAKEGRQRVEGEERMTFDLFYVKQKQSFLQKDFVC
jgi:hypothetical protein